jgi:hypothetical protein
LFYVPEGIVQRDSTVIVSWAVRQWIGDFNQEIAILTDQEQLEVIISELDHELAGFIGSLTPEQEEERQFYATKRGNAQLRLDQICHG